MEPVGRLPRFGDRRVEEAVSVPRGDANELYPQGSKAALIQASGGNEPSQSIGASTAIQPAEPPRVLRERPPVGSPERNHRIDVDDVLAPHGITARLTANLDAIRLLKRLEAEERNPAPDEKKRLAQYVGWGGLPQVFDDAKADAFASGEHSKKFREASRLTKRRESWQRERLHKEAYAIERWREQWGAWHDEMKTLLTPEEYEAAAASTLNAHYTGADVIDAMWRGAERLGFRGGSVLEPAGGVGHFIGLMPENLVAASHVSAVELDTVSGRILQKLYPEADVQVTGFQDAQLPDNAVDLALSNVPFGSVSVHDTAMEKAGAPALSLHNYFFVKALQKVRPGGLVAFVTSSHTLDSSPRQRRWLAGRGELIAAVRLPNTAFRESANTEVVADILFMRKPDGTPPPFPVENFTATGEASTRNGGKILVNEYFVRHPEMILGELANDGHMYGARAADQGQMTVHPHAHIPLAQSLNAALASLPQNVIGGATETGDTSRNQGNMRVAGQLGAGLTPEEQRELRRKKPGTLFLKADGSIGMVGTANQGAERQKPDAQPQDEEILQPKRQRLAEHFIHLRDALNELYRRELDPASDDPSIDEQRAELNRRYDTFVYHHGNLHKHAGLLSVDPDYYRLLGTEVEKKPEPGQSVAAALSRKKIYRKGDVFTRRVLTPRTEPTHAATLADALGISLGWRGRLDARFMASLLARETADVEGGLLRDGLAFRNPESGLLETREEYLSGNVRRKLRVAENAAQGEPAFAANVAELRRVHPADIKIEDIKMRLGSAWIPAAVITRFARETLGSDEVSVAYHPGFLDVSGDSWEVRYRHEKADTTSFLTAAMSQTYGTKRLSALALLERALNLQPAEVFDLNADGERKIFNPAATTQAKMATQRLADAFEQWVHRNPAAQTEIAAIYNELNNSHVLRNYDGQFLQFPWLASGFDLFPDKKNVVWQALQDGRMLVAHGVGGGKTLIGTAIAMELKRIGHAKKPLIVVHNATLEQFAATITNMAPTARVLVARRDDLRGPKRKEFMARLTARSIEAMPEMLSFSEQKAVLSGELGLRLFNANQRVADLEAEKEAWRRSLFDAGRAVKDEAANVEECRKSLATMDAIAGAVAAWPPPAEATFAMAGKTATGARAATALLKEIFEQRLSLIRSLDKATIEAHTQNPVGKAVFNGMEIEFGKPKITVRPSEQALAQRWKMEVPITINGWAVARESSPAKLLQALQNLPGNFPQKRAFTRAYIDQSHDRIQAATEEMQRPFAKAAELEAALQEQAEVLLLLSEKPKKKQAPEAEPVAQEPTEMPEPAQIQDSEAQQESTSTPEPAQAEDSSVAQQFTATPEPAQAEDSSVAQQFTATPEPASIQESAHTSAPKQQWKSSLMREIEVAAERRAKSAQKPGATPEPAPRRNMIPARSLLNELKHPAIAANAASPTRNPCEQKLSPPHESITVSPKRRVGMRV